jgi:PAS domain S-box-containing protein
MSLFGWRRGRALRVDHFFAASHDLLCIAGVDGYFKLLNPAWERTLGYTTEYLLSVPFVDLVHPEDRAPTLEAARSVAAGRPVQLVNRYRCADGSYRWLSWSGTGVTGDGLLYAVARDVTADRETAEARSRLAAIVDSTDNAVLSKDLDGIITSWNPGAERIYGYLAEEVVGRSVELIYPPDRRHKVAETMARIAAGQSVLDHDGIRMRKDGTLTHLAVTISPVRDRHGTVIGAASIARDIGDQKRADERFRRFVLDAPDAIIIVDQGGRISIANEEAARLFGYPVEELTGRPIDLLVPERARERHAGHRENYLRHPVRRKMAASLQLTASRADGTEFPVDISLAPVETDDGLFVSATVLDISERIRTERELAAARDEALAAAELKSQFVAVVSHEIRTPMNGVIGLSRLLGQTELDPVQTRYVNAIRTSARGLLTIINDLLDFSKVEAGRLEVVPADFAPNELIKEVLNATAEAARDKPIEIGVHYSTDLPALVRGDAHRIRQILLNLTSNAVKFTSGGEIVLRVGRAGPDRYTFSVMDTGIGIEPAVLSRLFEPFTQADATTSRTYGGTGLGLAISRQLAELLGGEVGADSMPGLGSRFALTVPLVTVAGPRPRHRPGGPLSGRRILVVDDNANCRELLGEHARSWGLAVTTAADPATAARALAEPFDVVVVDRYLAGTDATTLVRDLLGDGPAEPLVIVLTSGSHVVDDPDVPARVPVLPKPVTPSDLYDCLVSRLTPAARGPEDAAPSPAQPRPAARGTVLLAEDNEINQLVAVDTLTTLGYATDIARNGLEALDLIATRAYAAVLMDCQMPKMDGFEATRELRRREDGRRHLPVIAMTAGALAEDRQRCLDAGMDDYLAKPIDLAELRAVLERWVFAPAR